MGSTAASATFHAYGQLIGGGSPAIHPLIRSASIHPSEKKRSDRNGTEGGQGLNTVSSRIELIRPS